MNVLLLNMDNYKEEQKQNLSNWYEIVKEYLGGHENLEKRLEWFLHVKT